DVTKYADTVREVNSRANCWAVQTQMWELENYIHPSLYAQEYPIQGAFIDFQSNWKSNWSDRNIPDEFSVFLKNEKAAGNLAIMNEGAGKIKGVFSSRLSTHMNEHLFRDLNAYDEVNGWFDRIK
ncbi:hypothetical protein, partial [Klebsiella pneumoniae]